MDRTLILIIAANVIFSYLGFNDMSLFNKYKFQVGAIKNGEFIRHISSGFLHADYQHLFFNMLTLYFFAPMVISRLGTSNFLLIYFASLLLGSLLSFQYHKNENHYSAIGASGAVSGILYAAIMIYPQMTINFFIPGWLFAIGYMYYTIYGMKNQLGNIGHTAHLGGAIAGFLFALFLDPMVIQNNKIFVLFLALPILYLLFFDKRLNQ